MESVTSDGAFRAGPLLISRRRRHRQDQHARAPGGASRPGGRRAGACPPPYVQPAGGSRDDPAHAAHRRCRAGGAGGRRLGGAGCGAPAVVRDFSFDRQPPDPAPLPTGRPRRSVHGARPRRCGGPDGRRAPRAGLFPDGEALPAQGHLPRHLFPPRQHAGRARRDARAALSVVRGVGARAHPALPGLRRAQARHPGARLRRSPALLARHDGGCARSRREIGGQFDHVLVDEYQDTNLLQAQILLRLRPGWRGRHRGGRRRAGDLFVSRRHGGEHPRVSRPLPGAGGGRHPGGELPLVAGGPRRGQRAHRRKRAAIPQGAARRSRGGRAPALRERCRRPGAGRTTWSRACSRPASAAWR